MPEEIRNGRYAGQLFLFTTLVAISIFLLKYILQVSFIHDTIWYILLYVLFQTLFSFWIIGLGIQKSQESFIKYTMTATIIRLTLSLLIIFVALQLGINHRLSFVLNFLITYFIFLIFELISLLANLRANSK